MGNWDITTPADSDFISLGDDQIRGDKTAIQEALRGGTTEGLEAIFPGSAPTTAPVFRYRGLKGTTGARPSFGQYGLYINTTLNTLQRDSGSAWEDVATLIPSGTKMPFYQASPPTGWTAVAVNDKFMRVVTSGGTGGTNGGTVAASTSLAHTHTLVHTHDLGNHTHSTPAHQHQLEQTAATITNGVTSVEVFSANTDGAAIEAASSGGNKGAQRKLNNRTENSGGGTSGTPSSNTSGAASSDTTSSQFAGAFAYADFCVGTKD